MSLFSCAVGIYSNEHRLVICLHAISFGHIASRRKRGPRRRAHAANKDDGKNIHTVYAGHHTTIILYILQKYTTTRIVATILFCSSLAFQEGEKW